ncbi:Universal stress protein A-like protein [Linum grandiflorum]
MEGQQPIPPTRIVIAINESTMQRPQRNAWRTPASISSIGAFQWTLQKIVRSNVDDFSITFLSVLPSHEQDTSDVQQPTAEEVDEVKNKLLTQFARRCYLIETKSKIACDVLVGKGDPKQVICREANRLQPDLLVVGSRGLDVNQRMLVPSVSHYVLTNAQCPVAVIKRRAELAPVNPFDD